MAAPDVQGVIEPLASFVRLGLVLAPGAGRNLFIVSGRRSAADQQALREAHCPDPASSPASACSPATAPVGKSKHQTGQAVDMGGDLTWFAKLVRPFNVTRPVSGENWHFEWRGNNAASDLQKLAAEVDRQRIRRSDVIAGLPDDLAIDSGGFLDTLSDLVPGIPGVGDVLGLPGEVAGQVGDAFGAIGDVFGAIRDFFTTENLLRVVKGLAGVWLLFAGFGIAATAIVGLDRIRNAATGAAAGGPAGAAAGAVT